MKRLLALMAAVLVTVPTAQPASAAPRGKCRTSSTTGGAKIVRRTSAVVVFSKRLAVYGCAYSGGPVAPLLDEGGGINTAGTAVKARLQIAGRYVAYTTRGSGIGDEFDRVVVWDLKAGRDTTEAASNFVRSLVVKTNGSVAWVQGSTVRDSDATRPVLEVREVSQAAYDGDLLLYRGVDVDPQSLALSPDRSKVTWNVGTTALASPLP